MIQMKVLNWVQGKLNNSVKMVPHKRGITVTNETVDTRVILNSVNLEGLDDILSIGTFGFDELNLSSSKAEEDITASKSLVVEPQETEEGQETDMGISEPTVDTCVSVANEVCLVENEMLDNNQLDSDDNNAMKNEVCVVENEMLDNQLDSDDNNAMKKKKMTLADLFLADDCFFRNPDNVSNIIDVKKSLDCRSDSEERGERLETVLSTTPPPAAFAALIQTKDVPSSCSFVKKLPIPCISTGKDSSCVHSRLTVQKLHRMMAKMLKKKKKIHPAAVQYDGKNIADAESKITTVCA